MKSSESGSEFTSSGSANLESTKAHYSLGDEVQMHGYGLMMFTETCHPDNTLCQGHCGWPGSMWAEVDLDLFFCPNTGGKY